MIKNHARYSPELMDKICHMVACGAWLAEIEKLPGMPCRESVWAWRVAYPEAREKYEEAVMRRCETVQDEHKNMIKNCPLNANAIKLVELQIKTDTWYMERLFPKKFGQRTVIAGDKDNPIHLGLAQSLEAKIAEAKTKPRPAIDHKPRGNDLAVIDVVTEETV